MNTISSAQNTIDLYNLKTEKIAKALEIAKAEQKQKETEADSVKISEQALLALDNTAQNTTNRVNPLDALVSSGTITQDQANAIQSAFQAVGKAIQSSGIYNNKPTNPLDSLVSAGTITEEQVTAIKNAFESSIKSSNHHLKDPGTTTLDSSVSAGTITQTQEDAIQNAFETIM